ncbi:hypothetical protein MUK42_10555 [Musa troglodytarum]|uniref:Uncharacterized protein n=1 Tax=Musa troglodytarum TaxID=320322 RepID=A0A9E7JZU8_9LILI|nr:hypothetical protein MUK42_10555 [Musa troglodytarum]
MHFYDCVALRIAENGSMLFCRPREMHLSWKQADERRRSRNDEQGRIQQGCGIPEIETRQRKIA